MERGIEIQFCFTDADKKVKTISAVFLNNQRQIKRLISCAKEELIDTFTENQEHDPLIDYLYKTFYSDNYTKDVKKLAQILSDRYSENQISDIRNAIYHTYNYHYTFNYPYQAYISSVSCF